MIKMGMPEDTLTKTSFDEIDRQLYLDSRTLKGALAAQGKTAETYAEEVKRRLLVAPRADKPPLYWELAQAYHLMDDSALAREAAKKYLSARPPTALDKVEDAAKQRGRHRFRKEQRKQG